MADVLSFRLHSSTPRSHSLLASHRSGCRAPSLLGRNCRVHQLAAVCHAGRQSAESFTAQKVSADSIQAGCSDLPTLPTPPHPLTQFHKVVLCPAGVVHVQPLSKLSLQSATQLLTETYATTHSFSPYKKYLTHQIRSYMKEHINLIPKAIVLTAMLTKTDDSLPELVGVVELSFKPETRSQYWTLNPPARCAYLCNMAVPPAYRRQGIASTLVKAAEEVAAIAGEKEVYLHVRLQDAPAKGLYLKAGFSIVDQDNLLVALLGSDRRYLFCKQLAAPDLQAVV